MADGGYRSSTMPCDSVDRYGRYWHEAADRGCPFGAKGPAMTKTNDRDRACGMFALCQVFQSCASKIALAFR